MANFDEAEQELKKQKLDEQAAKKSREQKKKPSKTNTKKPKILDSENIDPIEEPVRSSYSCGVDWASSTDAQWLTCDQPTGFVLLV